MRRLQINFISHTCQIVPIMGVIGKDYRLYFSAFDVALFLRISNAYGWAMYNRTCFYRDVDTENHTIRRNVPMIERNHLILVLRYENPWRVYPLMNLLEGSGTVTPFPQIYGEHCLVVCACSKFYGVPFLSYVYRLIKFLQFQIRR